MILTKARIADELFAQDIFTRTESARIIDTLFELMKKSLQKGVVLGSGFGKFSVKKKATAQGQTPTDREVDEAAAGKNGDIQVFWRFAGGDERGGE
jgi:integration host factor subunit alpha